MPLSTNSLFHYTKELKVLESILSDGFFKVHYCKESIEIGTEVGEFYVPMVSFCDIPMSEVKNHIVSYGEYGLGLTKEWASKQRLNPVLYIEHNSSLAASILTALRTFTRTDLNIDAMIPERKSIHDILRYVKNYEGDLRRKIAPTIEKYRFSDEREWRFVPSVEAPCPMMPRERITHDMRDIDSNLANFFLPFNACDIRYIIIKDDSELSGMVDFIRQIYQSNADRLLTRIITIDQIKNDL
jgi:hypothetical protein